MAGLELSGIRKTYGALDVLHGIDLAAEDGEFIVLVGPSGCGKSTLLRMIAGLDSASAGEIRIGGRPVSHLPPKDRDIAMVFQSYALYPHMRVAANMSFALRLARRATAEIDSLVGRASGILGLGDLLDRLPKDLSGGQRQRVAMGRAIVREPKVFLFDEPLSNLDAKLRVQMRAEIKGLHQRLGTTTVYVTHDQIEAMTMADRIVVMQGGRVEQIGTPLELYDSPANVFVATFIGSPAMNLIPGTVTEDGMRAADGQVWPVPPGLARPGQEVVLGIRAEHLHIAETGIPCEVALVEPTGAETMVWMQTASGRLVVSTRDRAPIRVGDRRCLAIDTPRSHLFDAGTGLCLTARDMAG